MNYSKLIVLLTSYLVIFCQQTAAQFGGMGYPYGGMGGIFGYPTYGYYPQYPMYGSYPCYTSIYCGGGYYGYGRYPFYGNSFRTGFSSSSSSGFSTSFASNGGFFG
ncbi:shematrin-like protein 1 [Lucilia sericata]|uniref:shematrin-like protein 1 n=1 Tax=Lucilia sericata TaxID=13632 RepID=UPI0018A80C95|nr:shematrin-like protein 1 [Lucilia sericata]